MIDRPARCGATQKDLNRLEKRANKEPREVQHRETQKEPQAPGQAGADRLESNLAAKDLGVLMDTKLTMRQ